PAAPVRGGGPALPLPDAPRAGPSAGVRRRPERLPAPGAQPALPAGLGPAPATAGDPALRRGPGKPQRHPDPARLRRPAAVPAAARQRLGRRGRHAQRRAVRLPRPLHRAHARPAAGAPRPGSRAPRPAPRRGRRDRRRAEGAGTQPLLASGQFFELVGHPREACNQLWLLGEVRHQGYQPQVLEAFAEVAAEPGERQPGYRNQFLATPWDSPYRLRPEHPKPRLLGSQSAVVSGPPGEDIHCDDQGRVQVRFHWERESRDPAHSQAWLRVASGWAGDRYGALLIPPVGMEVLVGLLDGDPERLLVTGCLYHAGHEALCALPEHHTRSVLRTRSSPGGEGFNELRIEDRQGAEEIHLHAQRDWEQRIRNDHRLYIGHDHHGSVEG